MEKSTESNFLSRRAEKNARRSVRSEYVGNTGKKPKNHYFRKTSDSVKTENKSRPAVSRWDIAANFLPLFAFAAAFVIFCVIFRFAPLTSDDIEFAGLRLTSLSEIVRHSLSYGNGRFLGNAGAVIMASNTAVRTLVRAFALASITVLIPYAVGAKKKETYLISLLLTLWIAPRIFAQAYAWSSGFQNYIPPVLAMSAVCAAMRFCERSVRPLWCRVLVCAGVTIVGFCGQLYAEHSTCVAIIAAAVLLVVAIIRCRRILAPAVCWFASTALGGLAMFLIPKLFAPEGTRSELYRRWVFESGDAKKIIDTIFTDWSFLLSYLAGSLALVELLTLTVLFLVYKERNIIPMPVSWIICVICGVSLILFPINSFTAPIYALGKVRMDALLPVLLVIALLYLVLESPFFSARTKTAVWLIVIIAAGAVLPMALARPNGPRVTAHSYFLFCAAVMLTIDASAREEEVKKSKSAKKKEKKKKSKSIFFGSDKKSGKKEQNPALAPAAFRILTLVCLAAVIVTSVSLINRFIGYGELDAIRTEHFEKEYAAGARVIEYYPIKDKYLWVYEDDNWPYGNYWYREKYNDIKFKPISQEKWFEKYYDK